MSVPHKAGEMLISLFRLYTLEDYLTATLNVRPSGTASEVRVMR